MNRVKDDPIALLSFPLAMPKGRDLHHHLTGAVYAESYIDYADEDGDCFDAEFTIVAPHATRRRACRPPRARYRCAFAISLINALSDRNFSPTPGDTSRLVNSFKTFFKFDLVTNGHWCGIKSCALSKLAVFAQMLSGFEIANVDKRVLGLNIVEAKDDTRRLHSIHAETAMAFNIQMMIQAQQCVRR